MLFMPAWPAKERLPALTVWLAVSVVSGCVVLATDALPAQVWLRVRQLVSRRKLSVRVACSFKDTLKMVPFRDAPFACQRVPDSLAASILGGSDGPSRALALGVDEWLVGLSGVVAVVACGEIVILPVELVALPSVSALRSVTS